MNVETPLQERLPQEKLLSPKQAAQQVKGGDTVFLGTACATPNALTAALEGLESPPPDVTLLHFLTTNAVPDGGKRSSYRHKVFFVGTDVRHLMQQGQADYVPIALSEVPKLLANGRVAVDVAFIQVSPPDRNGYVSLGVSVDVTKAVARHARKVIAEINPHMPRTLGDTFIHLDDIDHLVLVDTPVIEYVHAPANDIAGQIARYIAGIIDDGSTLQIGLGRIPNEALKFLSDRRHLGIHSDVITDAIVDLVEAGIITGSEKSLAAGRIVASYCLGTRRLYDLIDNNPMFDFQPIEQVCEPHTIARHNRMVSITQAFALDLTGQACVDQFGGQFYGGVSTQPDFMRGAARSRGGKPILCLTSTTDDGESSRIRPLLDVGEGVGIARSDIHYVVTEYGIAYLFGKSIRERALALIEVAHPKFRPWLLDEAKRLGYVHAEQFVASTTSYAIEEERQLALKDGRKVLIRPAKASDAAALQQLFHKMSQDDVYTRFFRRLHSLTYAEAQALCNVDCENEAAFVAVTGSREHESLVGSSCYFVNQSTNLAEVAFMIDPGWQGTGLGGQLQLRMKEFAQKRGLIGFTAEILIKNAKMIRLAKAACDNVAVERDDDTFHVTMLF
jgi:acyl-CoA hydrolase/RimJ/RimL family protein N-acetyltransferase